MKIRIAAVTALVLLASACAQTTAPVITPPNPKNSGGYFRPDIKDDMTARIVPGQTDAEVMAILGEPHRKVRFDNLGTTAWDYMYMDTFGYWVAFSVMVNDNKRVVSKVTARIDPPGAN